MRMRARPTRCMGDDVKAMAIALRRHPMMVVAYCLYTAWAQYVLISPVLMHDVEPDAALLDLALPYATIGIVCLVVALWFKARRPQLASGEHRVAIVAAMVLGTLCEAAGVSDGGLFEDAAGAVLYALRCLFVALGVALFRVEIDRALGWVGAVEALRIVSVGTILMLPVGLGLACLPRTVGLYVSLALPVGALACLLWEVRTFPKPGYYAVDRGIALPFPRQFVGTSFVQGLASGVFYGLVSSLAAAGVRVSPLASPAFLASWPLGILAVLLAVSFAKLDYNRLIYKVGFPLLAASFMLLVLLPPPHVLGELLHYGAAVYTDVILWSLGAYIMRDMGMPACWIASLPGAALFCGTASGACVMWLLDRLASGVTTGVVAPLFMACGLLFASLVLLSDRNMRSGWGTFRLGVDEASVALLDAAVGYVAREYSLTPREAQVASAIARGLTRHAAADELSVSDETVKTHLRAIY